MTVNMGQLDRVGRLILAAVLLYLALGTTMLSGALFWVAIAVAAVFVATSIVGNCPLYSIIGVKTCRSK